MKTANISCLVWSSEDLDLRAQTLYLYEQITKEYLNDMESLSEQEKIDIVEEAIESLSDFMMEEINRRIDELIIEKSTTK
jgi:hypothetical protein